jgi:hypothetical protein
VVRRMFELCAAGAGLTRITKTLNAEGVLALRPQLGRPHAWASSVRAVLADHSTRARSRGTNRESAIVGASSTSTRGPRRVDADGGAGTPNCTGGAAGAGARTAQRADGAVHRQPSVLRVPLSAVRPRPVRALRRRTRLAVADARAAAG